MPFFAIRFDFCDFYSHQYHILWGNLRSTLGYAFVVRMILYSCDDGRGLVDAHGCCLSIPLHLGVASFMHSAFRHCTPWMTCQDQKYLIDEILKVGAAIYQGFFSLRSSIDHIIPSKNDVICRNKGSLTKTEETSWWTRANITSSNIVKYVINLSS